MRTLYLDLGMGAAGDMLTAALLELLDEDERDAFVATLNELGLGGVTVTREMVTRAGIAGTHMRVVVNGAEEGAGGPSVAHAHDGGHGTHGHAAGHGGATTGDDGGPAGNHVPQHDHGHDHVHDAAAGHVHDHAHDHHDHDHHHGDHDHHHGDHDHHHHHHHHHHHASMTDVTHLVRDHMRLPGAVRNDVLAVYRLIADAESRAHGVDVSAVHFHEVGMKDAIMDIAAVCLLMARIAPERVVASPVHVGAGTVRCAHGVVSVPAPATAFLLEGVPTYGGTVMAELCTPTGAALVRHFVNEFAPQPLMRVERIGHGMGTRELGRANCLRAMLGETDGETDAMLELSCNVDDMTAEEAAFACEEVLAAGAAEVYAVPIVMKKGRPGLLVRAICEPARRDVVVRALFAHTTTIGVRELSTGRYVLARTEREMTTAYGAIRVKESSGYGVVRRKYEYDDLARIARERGTSLIALKAELDSL